MSNRELRTVCAGLGFVGSSAHVPSFRKVPDSKLLGVVARRGRNSERIALQLREKYGLNIYYDWEAVCQDPEVDAVCVAVPTPSHYEMAKRALEGGKHVLLEMPMAPRLEQVEELGELAKKKGVVLMPILNFRRAPGYVKARELLKSGAIGEPMAFTFRELVAAEDLAKQWPPSSWAWDKEKSGGYPDFTLSVWSLDMFRWFFETEIENVKWAANYRQVTGVADFNAYQTMGVIRLRNGAVGSLTYGASVAKGQDTSRFEVFGNNGKTIVVDWNDRVTLVGRGDERESWKLEPKGPEVWGHKQWVAHFVQACLGRERPEATYRDAIAAQKWSSKIVTELI
ncbi:MAG: Gfo/Idh/MocA family oxidoreductase [Candidatus Thorarchaeota archaeon]